MNRMIVGVVSHVGVPVGWGGRQRYCWLGSPSSLHPLHFLVLLCDGEDIVSTSPTSRTCIVVRSCGGVAGSGEDRKFITPQSAIVET